MRDILCVCLLDSLFFFLLPTLTPPTMSRFSVLLTLLLLAMCVSVASRKSAPHHPPPHSLALPCCGRVYDGDINGEEEEKLKGRNEYAANWNGFNCKQAGGSIDYTLFIVDSKNATSETLASGANASDSRRCRRDLGVNSRAVVLERTFRNIRSSNFSYVNDTRGKLRCDHRYFTIIEACNSDGCIYSNSNGFDYKCHHGDDDLAPWKAGLIAMGCALCCLLLLLLLLIVVVAKGKGDDKYTTTVHRNENVEKM